MDSAEAIPIDEVPSGLDAKSARLFGIGDLPVMEVATEDPEPAELGPGTMVFPASVEQQVELCNDPP